MGHLVSRVVAGISSAAMLLRSGNVSRPSVVPAARRRRVGAVRTDREVGGLLGGGRIDDPVPERAISAAREAIFGRYSQPSRRMDLEASFPMNPMGRDLNDDGSVFRGHWSSGMTPPPTDSENQCCSRCSRFCFRRVVIIPSIIVFLMTLTIAGAI